MVFSVARLITLLSRSSQVGDEVLLKGAYLELGVHSVGSFGTVYVHYRDDVRRWSPLGRGTLVNEFKWK